MDNTESQINTIIVNDDGLTIYMSSCTFSSVTIGTIKKGNNTQVFTNVFLSVSGEAGSKLSIYKITGTTELPIQYWYEGTVTTSVTDWNGNEVDKFTKGYVMQKGDRILYAPNLNYSDIANFTSVSRVCDEVTGEVKIVRNSTSFISSDYLEKTNGYFIFK